MRLKEMDIFSTFMGATVLGAAAWMAFDSVKKVSNLVRDYVSHRKGKREFINELVRHKIIANTPDNIKRAHQMMDSPTEGNELANMAQRVMRNRVESNVNAKLDLLTLNARNEAVIIKNELMALLNGKATAESNADIEDLVDDLIELLQDETSYKK